MMLRAFRPVVDRGRVLGRVRASIVANIVMERLGCNWRSRCNQPVAYFCYAAVEQSTDLPRRPWPMTEREPCSMRWIWSNCWRRCCGVRGVFMGKVYMHIYMAQQKAARIENLKKFVARTALSPFYDRP